MRVIRWPGEQERPLERSVATLGVYDGVHRGHAAVIRRLVREAEALSCPAVVVTFSRHPAAVVEGERRPSITSVDHRLRLMEKMSVDLCVVVEFTEETARTGAREFAQEVFCTLLGAEVLVLGFNCRFGHRGEGDTALLREMGFEVVEVAPVMVDGRTVSSTAVREAVREGDLERASRLLGRPFSLYGTVVAGEDRGEGLGYPTANLDLHNEAVPPEGVYAVWAYVDDRPRPAVVSIGTRPTFHPEPDAETVVEVHLIDFAGDLYGTDLEVQFVQRLRGQRVCSGAEELEDLIADDVRRTRRLLREEAGEGA